MSISSSAGSSGVLAQQQFAPQSQETHTKTSSPGGDAFNILSAVQPAGSTPPASTSATTTGFGAPSGGQADPVSQQLTNLQSYLLGLQPDVIPGTANSAATSGTPSGLTDAANAAAAYQYTIGTGSASNTVSSAMIC
jgi:hypothetical protein